MNNTKKFFVVSFFTVLMVFTIFSSFNKNVQAATTDNIYGYAWSSNIGWISLNCTNTNTCGTSNYGITIANNGDVTGYAWSSNIGWIKFGGFANTDFPNYSGDGTQPHNANLSGSNITGWARACSVYASGCSGTLKSVTGTELGGWDGWISLIGNNYGVTVSSSGAVTGFAWGSDVVGWIQFNGSTIMIPPTLSLNATANGASGTTLTVNSGDQVTLSSLGSLLNTSSVNGVASYTVDPNGAANWPTSEACPTSSTNPLSYTPFTVTNPSSTTIATYTYTLTCKKASDNSNFVSNTITIIVNPTPANAFNMLANGANEITIHSGNTVTITTYASPGYLKPTNQGTTANDPTTAHWDGSQACPQSLTPVTLSSFALINPSTTVTTTYIYTLSCIVVDTGVTVGRHVAVNILPADSVVSLFLKVSVNGSTPSAGPITINPGDTITFSSTGSLLNTTANAGTKSISWSGAVTCPASLTTPLSYTPITLTAAGTNTYYKISCPKASDGTAYDSNIVTVYVSSPPSPTVTLKAYSDPSYVHQITSPLPSSGGNVYLQWSSTNAASCASSNLNNPTSLNISGWSGLTQAISGSTGAINITHSTTFVMACSSLGGSNASMAPVQVGQIPPYGCPMLGIPPCPKKQPVFIEI